MANKKILKIISVIPITLLYVILFYGILISAIRSFGIYEAVGLNKFTLEYFINIIASKNIQIAIIRTFVISFLEAFVSVILALLITIYLIKNKTKNHTMLYMPVAIPHIVIAMMMILLFAQNGFISRILYHIGIIKSSNDFLLIINDKYNIGVIIAYIFKGTAYVLSVIYIIVKKNNDKYYEAAYLMNASFAQYVKDVLIPTSSDSMITSFLILFSYSFGAYELPYLLGNTGHKLLPVIAYEKYLSPNLSDKPIFLSINLVMIIIGIIILLIYKKILDGTYVKK